MGHAIKLNEYGLDVIYRHDYKDEHEGKTISGYILESCRYLEKFLTNVSHADKLKTFLDVGCGNTQAIDYFEKKGYKAGGIDLYPHKEDDRVKVSNFYNMSKDVVYGKGSQDIVFCNHTLEHSLGAPLLEQIRDIQPIGGVLFIAVPDADYSWAYDITSSTTHWTIYNEGFLRHLVTRYGYECHVAKKCFRAEKGELFLVGIRRF